jgi:hypothetical protein
MFANLSIFYYDIINKFDLNINKIITSEMPYKNYQEHLANCAEYRANNKETVKMSYCISKWIARGLIETDQYTYEELYIPSSVLSSGSITSFKAGSAGVISKCSSIVLYYLLENYSNIKF